MRRGGWDGLGGEECRVQGRERHPEHVRQAEQPLVSNQGPHLEKEQNKPKGRKEGRKEGIKISDSTSLKTTEKIHDTKR